MGRDDDGRMVYFIRGFEIFLGSGNVLIVVGQTREEFLGQLYRCLQDEGDYEEDADPRYKGGFDGYGDPFITAQVITSAAPGWQRRATIRADHVMSVLDEREVMLYGNGSGTPSNIVPSEAPDDSEDEGDDEGAKRDAPRKAPPRRRKPKRVPPVRRRIVA